MCIGGWQLKHLPKMSSLLPLTLQVSQRLPSLASLDAEIAKLQTQLRVGGGLASQAVIQKSLDEKLALRKTILDPSVAQGVPPAPEGPGLFGPRIEAPKVGVNDLKILLPTS